jgi:hypothetical protein
MLGDALCTMITLDSLSWVDGPASVAILNRDCEICVNICREGGSRLFSASGRVQLFQNQPNPFNATTSIEYEVVERGYTELSVYSIYGEKIQTLAAEVMEPGKYRIIFDAARMSSGMYMYVLRTPSQTFRRTMILVK